VAWSVLRPLAEALLSNKGIAAGYTVEGAGFAFSAAAALDLLARAIVRLADGGTRPGYLLARRVLGPGEPAPALLRSFLMGRRAFVDLCRDLADQIGAIGQLPAALVLDKVPIAPEFCSRRVPRPTWHGRAVTTGLWWSLRLRPASPMSLPHSRKRASTTSCPAGLHTGLICA